MSPPLVFAHGLGRDGPSAWPVQVAAFPNAIYLSRPADESLDSVDYAAATIRSASSASVVVAHSFGAVAAARAVAADDGQITAAVLIEPALHRLARGGYAVERHIARVDPVFAHSEFSLEEFWLELVMALSGNAAEGPLDNETLRTASGFRRLGPPWRHEIEAGAFVGHPTLVVTGGWNDEYEEIATRLETDGATRAVLPGYGHRPQDHPDFNGTLAEFVADLVSL